MGNTRAGKKGHVAPIKPDFEAVHSTDPVAVPKRVAFIQRNLSAHVRLEPEPKIMTFPHLVVRGVIGFELLLILLSLMSLLLNAPLEGLADPLKTPNPAKAPWYFLGLQELLHYFPPVVAGVLIPTLVGMALVIIPYFQVNVVREKLWKEDHSAQPYGFAAAVLALIFFLVWFRVWVILVPTVLIALLMISTFFRAERGPWGWFIRHTPWTEFFASVYAWLARRSLAAWIMAWFVTVTVILTVVGTFFRGPGWSWIWPWE